MHLEQDLWLWADRIPDRFHERDRPELLGTLQLVMTGPERVELEGLVPPLDDLFRGGMKLFGLPLHPIPAVGVGLDALAHRPAEQVVDGLAQSFADDIPAGRLEGGYPRAHHLSGPREVVAAHLLDEILDAEGVVPDHVPRGGLPQVPDQGLGVVDHPRLAQAGQTLVGVEPHDGEVAPVGADNECRCVRNLHAFSSTVVSAGIPGKLVSFSVASASG